MTPRLISGRDAAKLLGISYSNLYGLVVRGEMPYVEIPSAGGKRRGRIMVDVNDVDAIVAKWKRGKR